MKYNKLLKIGIIGLSLVTLNATNIKHVQDSSKYPISSDLISVSRGGTLPDSVALTDGIGTILVGSLNLSNKSYSNKTFNKALFNHRNELIDNDKSLETLISDGIVVIPNNKLNKINNRNILVDITNGTCVGTSIITITGDDTNGRTWSDGTVAQSCNQYKNTLPDNYHKYQGNIGDGVYQITLNSNSFKVYCDMTTDNGGWMAVKYTNNLDTIVESSTHISTNYYLNINIIEDMLSISSEILFVEPSSNVKAKTIPSTYNTIVTNINSGNLWFNNMLNQEMSNYLVSVESGLLPDAIRAGCANNPGNLSIFDSCNNTEGAHSALNNHHRMRDGIYYGNKPNSVFIR